MKRIRRLLVLLLVLTYGCQSLAAIAPACPTMSAVGSATALSAGESMAAMAHAGHKMAADSAASAESAASDCCGDGLCNMGHCQSVAALPLSNFHGSRHAVFLYPRGAAASSPLHPPASLYRPPITR